MLKCFTGTVQYPAAALKHSDQFALQESYYCLKEVFYSNRRREEMSQGTHFPFSPFLFLLSATPFSWLVTSALSIPYKTSLLNRLA